MDEKTVDELGLSITDYIDVDPTSPTWLDMKDLPNEVWRNITDFDGKYKISNYGRVKSEYCGGHILKQGKSSTNYWIVVLSKDGKHYTRKVHKLVAQEFMPNLDNKPMIDHIQSVTTTMCNNKLINLRWVTMHENMQHSIRCGRFKKPPIYNKTGINHCNSKPVAQYTKDDELVNKYGCLEEAIRTLKVCSTSSISKCCKGKQRYAYGYKWKFISKEDMISE